MITEETQGLLQEHIQALLFGLVMTLFAIFIALKARFFQMPKRDGVGKLPFGYTLGVFVLYLTISMVLVPLAALGILSYLKGELITGNNLTVQMEAWINIGLIVSTALGLSAYLASMNPHLRGLVFGNHAFVSLARSAKDLLVGAGTWLIAFPVTIVIGQLLAIITLLYFPGPAKDQVAVKYVRMAQAYPGLFWIMVGTIIFLVPLLEEILFRGFLQTSLRGRMGAFGAIACTSIIFALFHYSSSQGTSNLEIVGSLFVLSCFLGFLYERQGSLWASVGLHAFFNLISILFLLTQ